MKVLKLIALNIKEINCPNHWFCIDVCQLCGRQSRDRLRYEMKTHCGLPDGNFKFTRNAIVSR